jgi:tight adherence protein C
MLAVIASLLVFAAIAVTAYATWLSSTSQASPMAVRLRALHSLRSSESAAQLHTRPRPLRRLIAAIGGFLPSRDGTEALRTGLVRGGFRRSDAVLVFLGAKAICAVGLPLLWVSIAHATARPMDRTTAWAVVFAMFGWYLPTMFLAWRQSERYAAMLSALPDALDLLVVCVESGLGVAAGLQRVAQEIHLASPVLASELSLVNREMQTGVSRSDALRHLAERTGMDDLYSLVAMLIQTDKLGTSVAASLRAHAESMRTKRRQRAEQMARKASIKLAFPLVFMVFPALLVIILGPAAIQLMTALVAGE